MFWEVILSATVRGEKRVNVSNSEWLTTVREREPFEFPALTTIDFCFWVG